MGSIVERVEYTGHIEMEEHTANDWQARSNVLRRKCVVKVVRL